jgi:membrane-associated phospholipid phosphatase
MFQANQSGNKTAGGEPPFGFYTIVVGAFASMTFITGVDYRWTLFLGQHRWRRLSDFMGRTLFEGELPGGGDPVVVMLLIILVCYFLAWQKSDSSVLRSWRPQLGFVVTAALTAGIFLVHSTKWVLGRARPHLVLNDGFPFSQWYKFGPLFVTDGIFRGSFPSGHTAAVFLLMTFAYILSADPSYRLRRRLVGWAWGGITLAFSLAMGIGRCMSLSHWISDVVGIIFLSWITMHTLYFWILRVPDQVRFYEINGRFADMPRFWELRLCWNFFFVFLGLMGIMIGLRAIQLHHDQWLAMFTLIGVFFVVFFGKHASGLIRSVKRSFL